MRASVQGNSSIACNEIPYGDAEACAFCPLAWSSRCGPHGRSHRHPRCVRSCYRSRGCPRHVPPACVDVCVAVCVGARSARVTFRVNARATAFTTPFRSLASPPARLPSTRGLVAGACSFAVWGNECGGNSQVMMKALCSPPGRSKHAYTMTSEIRKRCLRVPFFT